MKNYTQSGFINGEFLTLQRIHRTKAKNSHKYKNRRVFIQSSNFRPFNQWQDAMEMDKDQGFDSQVNAFEYFNCQIKEQGYRSSFYIAI